jgi:hypothetical protein
MPPFATRISFLPTLSMIILTTQNVCFAQPIEISCPRPTNYCRDDCYSQVEQRCADRVGERYGSIERQRCSERAVHISEFTHLLAALLPFRLT